MGLFRGSKESDFESEEDLKKRLALEGKLPGLQFDSKVKFPKNFHDRVNIAEQRRELMKELSPRTEGIIRVRLPRTSGLAITGDWHFGHPNTDNKRIQQEVEAISHSRNVYAVLTGDLIDGIHWGGASQSEQTATLDEQKGFLNAVFNKLRGKVLVGVSGEHDSKWASRSGPDPYLEFSRKTKAPYVRGVAEVDINVAGKQNYRLIAQHKMRGHSMYNKTHSQKRTAIFHNQGADIYVGSHTHRKGVSQDTIRRFGEDVEVTYVSTGPYKTSDEYTERKGFMSKASRASMGGVLLRINQDENKVEIDTDIIRGIKRWFR